jgi:hypothetical protein
MMFLECERERVRIRIEKAQRTLTVEVNGFALAVAHLDQSLTFDRGTRYEGDLAQGIDDGGGDDSQRSGRTRHERDLVKVGRIAEVQFNLHYDSGSSH